MTLTEAAERADIPRATVSSLVGGHHRATIPQAGRLADALGFHVETLFPTLLPYFEEAA